MRNLEEAIKSKKNIDPNTECHDNEGIVKDTGISNGEHENMKIDFQL